jgi:hypothetical protein
VRRASSRSHFDQALLGDLQIFNIFQVIGVVLSRSDEFPGILVRHQVFMTGFPVCISGVN